MDTIAKQVAHCLERAEELRAIADDMNESANRELLLRIASDYEKLAAAVTSSASARSL